MKVSEFWEAVETVFGESLGRSYAADIYLTSLGATALEALERGSKPDDVWEALVEETGRSESRWIHRLDTRERR